MCFCNGCRFGESTRWIEKGAKAPNRGFKITGQEALSSLLEFLGRSCVGGANSNAEKSAEQQRKRCKSVPGDG